MYFHNMYFYIMDILYQVLNKVVLPYFTVYIHAYLFTNVERVKDDTSDFSFFSMNYTLPVLTVINKFLIVNNM